MNADAAENERQYWKVFASRKDSSVLVVMRWSYERMFDTFEIIGTLPDGSPDYLHDHPDCTSGTVSRADVEAALND